MFHGTATPAELVAALSAVRDFAASADAMREEAEAKASSSGGGGGGDGGGGPGSFEALASSSLIRELLSSAADPTTSDVCQRLLSAVDADAARRHDATPATVLLPDAERFPELEKTRGAIADAEKALTDLLPVLRQKLIDGREGTRVSVGVHSFKPP